MMAPLVQLMTMTMLMLESNMMMDGACDNIGRYIEHHDVPIVWIFADRLEVSSAQRLNAVVPIIMISLIVYKCNLRGRPVGRPSSGYLFGSCRLRWSLFEISRVPTFMLQLLIIKSLSRGPWPSCVYSFWYFKA